MNAYTNIFNTIYSAFWFSRGLRDSVFCSPASLPNSKLLVIRNSWSCEALAEHLSPQCHPRSSHGSCSAGWTPSSVTPTPAHRRRQERTRSSRRRWDPALLPWTTTPALNWRRNSTADWTSTTARRNPSRWRFSIPTPSLKSSRANRSKTWRRCSRGQFINQHHKKNIFI